MSDGIIIVSDGTEKIWQDLLMMRSHTRLR